jgi:riboflavin-specific deaminase-like protein
MGDPPARASRAERVAHGRLRDVDLPTAYAVPGGAQRHLRVNFAASVDGAASVEERSAPLSGEADRELFHLLRSMADVVLVGAGTVRAEGYGGAWRTGRKDPPPIAVVTRGLDLDPESRLFTDTPVPPILVTCAAAPAERRERLAASATVVVAGADDVDLTVALDRLAALGLRRVLCEGGPSLFGSLLAAGLVDELCLTVAPLLAAGSAGRVARGAPVAVPLRLVHALTDGDFLFLRYSTGRVG